MAGDEKLSDNKPGDEGKEPISKAEFDSLAAERDKLKQDLEDMRLEVFSPQYMEFLDGRDKPKGPEKKEEKKELGDDELAKMTPKQILEKARELAREDLKGEIDKAKQDTVSSFSKEQREREVNAFARTHSDFETYRPIMYGLSLDPKNKDLSLDELYNASKEHVKRIHTEPAEAEKERQRRMSSEKPGGDSESLEKYTKMPPEKVAREALDEVKKEMGSIPSA